MCSMINHPSESLIGRRASRRLPLATAQTGTVRRSSFIRPPRIRSDSSSYGEAYRGAWLISPSPHAPDPRQHPGISFETDKMICIHCNLWKAFRPALMNRRGIEARGIFRAEFRSNDTRGKFFDGEPPYTGMKVRGRVPHKARSYADNE